MLRSDFYRKFLKLPEIVYNGTEIKNDVIWNLI